MQWRKDRLKKTIRELGYYNYDDGIRPKIVVTESCGFAAE